MSNSEPLPEGTVIMAEEQYAGRGQQQNKWFAEAGKNLTFTILLKPVFLRLHDQFFLTQVISLGVVKALENVTGPGIKIKWPNDIYYKDKKLGGILIENMVQGSKINNSVIGIGLNINQDYFPEHLPNATSVSQILQTNYDLTIILSEICRHVEAYYFKLKANKFTELKQEYLQYLYGLNESRVFTSNNETFNGTITGVTANGLLQVSTGAGLKEYNLKEIQFVIK